MRTPELKPLRIGEILDVSIKIYLRNALKFMSIVAIAVIPVQLLGTVFLLGIAPSPTEIVTESDINAFVGGAVVVAVILALAGLLASAACFKAVAEAYLGRDPRAGESIRFAAKRLHSLLWILFLTFFAVGLGLIALIIPGIYLLVSLYFGDAALLAEDRRGYKALSRSFELVRGRWWPTFGALVVSFLLTNIVSRILDVVFEPLLTVDPGESLTGLIVWTQILAFIVSVLTQPFTAAVAAIIYFDLRVRKEGFDLELLARQIGEQSSVGPGRASGATPRPMGAPPPPPPPAPE
jgi:hypothetical protein